MAHITKIGIFHTSTCFGYIYGGIALASQGIFPHLPSSCYYSRRWTTLGWHSIIIGNNSVLIEPLYNSRMLMAVEALIFSLKTK